jgi:hypothetical protein
MHKKKHITHTIVRADWKQIGLHSGWNKRKSGFGRVQVTYLMKTNFGLGPNGPRARPDKILKFRPLQISTSHSTMRSLIRLNATATSRLPAGTAIKKGKLILFFYVAILDSYRENLAALGSRSYSSRWEAGSDSWLQIYQYFPMLPSHVCLCLPNDLFLCVY